MPTLTLPQLVAGRELASEAVLKLGPIEGATVVVDARPLVSGSTSFAGQLVRSALLEGGATHLTVVGGPPEFLDDMRVAAEQLAVSERITFAPSDAGVTVPS